MVTLVESVMLVYAGCIRGRLSCHELIGSAVIVTQTDWLLHLWSVLCYAVAWSGLHMPGSSGAPRFSNRVVKHLGGAGEVRYLGIYLEAALKLVPFTIFQNQHLPIPPLQGKW